MAASAGSLADRERERTSDRESIKGGTHIIHAGSRTGDGGGVVPAGIWNSQGVEGDKSGYGDGCDGEAIPVVQQIVVDGLDHHLGQLRARASV